MGTAIGAGIGSGLNTGIKTGNPLAGLLSAGGSYLGGSIGGSALGSGIGSGTLGGTLGSTAANFLGPSLASTSLGSIAGSTLGSSLGGNIGQSLNPPRGPSNDPKAFHARQQSAMDTPPSLSQFASLSPEQQTSNIATQGVYGGGEGGDESKYFLNLINRRLVDPQGKVGDMGQVSGVENSFLSQLGLGGYGSSKDLLKGISNWGAA